MLKQVILLSFMVLSFEAFACSFGGSEVFKPTLERWQLNWDTQSLPITYRDSTPEFLINKGV